MTKKNLVRVLVFGPLIGVLLLVVLHPGNWQRLFGPKIKGETLWHWQNEFRTQADPTWQSPVQMWIKQNLGVSFTGVASPSGSTPHRSKDLLQVYESMLGDSSPRVRALALFNYSGVAEPEDVIRRALALQDDPVDNVRAAALNALLEHLVFNRVDADRKAELAKLTSPVDFTPLLTDENWRVRISAAQLLIGVGKEKERSLAVLRSLASSSASMERREGVRALAASPAKEESDYRAIVQLSETEEDSMVRYAAISSLSYFGEKSVPVLRNLLADESPLMSEAATSALAALGPKAIDAVPDLKRLADATPGMGSFVYLSTLHRIDPARFQNPYPETTGPIENPPTVLPVPDFSQPRRKK